MNADTPFVASTVSRAGSRVLNDRTATAAAIVLACIAIPCLFAPLFAPHDPLAMPHVVELKYVAPSLAYPMGTDEASRDVLSRLLYGGRLSLAVAMLATLVSVTVGTAYGAIAAWSGGVTGVVLDRILDSLMAIPRLLLLMAIFALWSPVNLPAFVILLGITGWYGLARLVRGQVLAFKARDFVASASALGATRTRILVRHILPNVISPVVVAATLGVGHVIVLEAGLSWLGIGVDSRVPSWGNMIDQDLSGFFTGHWWTSLFPGLAIILTVMAFNVLGDALLRAQSAGQSVVE